MKQGEAARHAAIAALDSILNRHKSFDDAFTEALRGLALEPRDRGFTHTLISTSLRRKGQCEAAIARHMTKPLPKSAGNAPLILLTAAAQLLYLDVPAHAVIDVAVTLARRDSHARHFAQLVNAVLRKVAAAGSADLSDTLSAPEWLMTRWRSAYGYDVAERIAASHLSEPPLDLSVKEEAEKWSIKVGGTLLPGGTVRVANAAAVESLPGFAEGAWWVQDQAAALPVKLLGDVRGFRVLDLCAAPGGKTAQLAAAGAGVIALDRSASRMRVLEGNLARLGLAARTVVADALAYDPGYLFDAILLDAPCSATGTIRRHPELPYLRSEADIAKLGALQDRLLDRAGQWLKPGGMMVYCTCSLERAEGEDRIDAFLAARPEFVRIPITSGDVSGQPSFITELGDMRTFPFMDLDGFYAARLRRR
ncbi:transcription antitermination factor NusB [soil metagenome]